MARTCSETLTVTAAAVLLVSVTAGAQDIRRIDDPSLARDRYERAVHAVLEIEGQKVELVFKRETVPGSVFLEVTTSARTTSTYRYLGHEGNIVRLRLQRGDSVDTTLTYFSNSGRFVVIPEELQHTRLQFEVIPFPERGILGATLLDSGQPR